ncbi:butyrophilin subfamily 3 member A1 isoform X1 [Megalops cyprinoides]|uniref:butyrophilin subfamily 3 member A1 isoform X1 n=1 Tax=Megalops cyprinoides TaxID=118141 RepID=UPI0018649F89|nr:butyrophilin subfamily 3 member A1 isoform X1 [Megalops cyprinoides]XP_036392704.1 butyrophilin subfamily 3 member A1 isoform X1 [Megalops cyprinoides]
MMKECLQFLIEPAKNLKIRLKESRKRVRNEKKQPLVENQLFIMELARELNRMCQRSNVLGHIWTCEDIWPPLLCRAFILEWGSVLESKERPMQTDGWPGMRDWKRQLLGVLVQGSEQDVETSKRIILDWTREVKNRPEQHAVWPGEPVVLMLDDLETQWRKGRMPNLLSAMELVMWAMLTEGQDKETIPQQWLARKQRCQNIDATGYIPHTVWNWICDAAVEVTLDPDTANPDLVISHDDKRMRCGFERKDVPNYHQRFDGWWCAVAVEGFTSGRHYWEVEVGERDWRLGVAKESALRKGYKSLNTQTGYLTLRLERGTELKALTVPFTPLPQALIPRKVGVYLDYEEGQLSFYNVEKRSHIYTYCETFTEKLYPLFGTVEIIKDLVIRSAGTRDHCFCRGPCLWG